MFLPMLMLLNIDDQFSLGKIIKWIKVSEKV